MNEQYVQIPFHRSLEVFDEISFLVNVSFTKTAILRNFTIAVFRTILYMDGIFRKSVLRKTMALTRSCDSRPAYRR